MSYYSRNLLLAISLASKHHKETPFITRPIAIAQSISDAWIYDEDIWIAAILRKIDQQMVPLEKIEEIFGTKVKAMIIELSSDKGTAKSLRKKMQIINAKTMSYGAKCVRLATILNKLSESENLEYLVWVKALVNNLRGCSLELEDKIDDILNKSIPECDLSQMLKNYFDSL